MLLALLLLAASPSWGSLLDTPPARRLPTPPPGSFERRAAAEAMQQGLVRWRRERAEYGKEHAANERIHRRREEDAGADPSAPPVPVERAEPRRFSPRPEAKVIEVVPDALADPTDGWLDEQVKHARRADAGTGGDAEEPVRK